MNIANQGEKVGPFLTDDRLIAVLEKVSATFVATIEVLCIPGKLLAHDRRYSVFAAFKQKMQMIGHEDPFIDFAAFRGGMSTALSRFPRARAIHIRIIKSDEA